jgi:AcrR family transcriptional regulator
MVETRRRQIENAASELFRERGYPATSVRDIARALDIQGASLYAHVASKEEMLWSIVDRAADRFDAEVAPIAEATALAPPVRLRRMVRAHVRVVTTDQGSAIVFLDEWRYLSPGRRASIAERRDAYEARFRAVIADGIATGDFQAADPTLAAAFALSALNGISAWYRPGGRLTSDQIADAYADMIHAALADPTAATKPTTTHGPPTRIDR